MKHTRSLTVLSACIVLICVLSGVGCSTPSSSQWAPLFPKDGVPEGWSVRDWADVSRPPKEAAVWEVRSGTLHGGIPRGSWLMSDKEYSDFDLEFDFKLGERGNSGLALRTPPAGDPAFDAVELQMADLRYNPAAKDSELTGGIYRAIAPRQQVYRPTEWNHYRVECRGPRIKAWLNNTLIQDVDLSHMEAEVLRHNGQPAIPLSKRPLKGRIGFQELSRGEGSVQIRNALIRERTR